MLVRFGMSVLTGLGFWTFTGLYGLDLSREWGVIAFVLNFIPFIGSFVATLLPTLFAAAQYETLSSAVWVFLGLNVVQFVVGSYIEPRITGRAVSVSPFMVLFAVFFWGMLWGIAGAFIGAADPDRVRQAVCQKPGDPRHRDSAVGRCGERTDRSLGCGSQVLRRKMRSKLRALRR